MLAFGSSSFGDAPPGGSSSAEHVGGQKGGVAQQDPNAVSSLDDVKNLYAGSGRPGVAIGEQRYTAPPTLGVTRRGNPRSFTC